MKDYYSILGVLPSAKYTEIRKAYRKRALERHPDVNVSSRAKENFIELQEAYHVLKNVQSRIRYDKLRESARNQHNSSQTEANQTWSKSQTKRSQAGRKRGETVSKKSLKTFKRNRFWSGAADIFAFFVDILSIFG